MVRGGGGGGDGGGGGRGGGGRGGGGGQLGIAFSIPLTRRQSEAAAKPA